MRGQTIFFDNAPRIAAGAAVAGPKECAGILGEYADVPLKDDMFGEDTFEKAERKMLLCALRLGVEKAGLDAVDAVFSGDLLNQIISASFAARETGFPYLGIYSACSTMSEGLLLGAMAVDGGYLDTAAAATGRVTRKTDFAGGEAGAYSGFFTGRESATKSSRANSSLAVTESSAYETAR